ncbi:MAG TPA: hypothetical protein VJ085_07065 [Candidatus Acidoferrales bacterium]|nr:hypothetical protein [Candidatus Acidoferrales bacterium]
MTSKTRVWTLALAAGLALLAAGPARAETFTYKVKHNHAVGSCQGVLVVGESDIRYQADNRADSRIWTYLDIKKVESPSVRKLAIYTHEDQTIQLGRDKVFDFEFIEGEVTDELYNFIVNRLARPQSATTPPTPPGGRWEMAAKHVHTFGGCEGTLKVTDNYIEYVTDNVNDARVWKYLDIKRLDSPSSYLLNIYTYEDTSWQLGRDRTFRFELKEPIEPQVYEFIRNKMNQ